MSAPGRAWLPVTDLKQVWAWDAWPDLGARPRVALGVPWTGVNRTWRLDPSRTWLRLEHQSGGLACHHPAWLLTELTPRPEVTAGLLALHQQFDESNLGTFSSVSVDDLIEYRAALNKHLGVDCNHAWAPFEEAVYPVDLTPAFLAALTADILPGNLNDWIEPGCPSDAVARILHDVARWQLLILTENSD